MFKVEQHIENNADMWATVFDRYTGEPLCDVAFIDDMGFLFDDEGFIGETFTVEGSGINSYRSRRNCGYLMYRDAQDIQIVPAN